MAEQEQQMSPEEQEQIAEMQEFMKKKISKKLIVKMTHQSVA